MDKRVEAEPDARGQVPDVGLGMLLRTANNAFYRTLRDELAKDDVSFSEFQHLRHLWHEEGLTQVELAARIGIGKASSTLVLDNLERRGLIERHRNPHDRRKQVVRLTPQGRAIEEGLWARAAAVNAAARRGLSDADVQQLYRTVERIVANLTSEDQR